MEAQAVIDALAERAQSAAVLELEGPRIAIVGGFVRDALRGEPAREIDLVVEGDVLPVARQLGGELTVHEPFLAAHVTREGLSVELTQARRERYPRPGALPVVEPATLEEDLPRRDFTVNALAVELRSGRLLAPPGALEDLAQRRLRVFHEQSFVDDPTRVLRLARYRARLGFAVVPETARLALDASLESVSGARIAGELRIALEEPDPLAALEGLEQKLPLSLDPAFVGEAVALCPADADARLVVLAAILRDAPPAWLDTLELTARERAVVDAAARAPGLAGAARGARSPSELRDVLRALPAEAVAIVGASGARAQAGRWLSVLRDVKLEISGADLIAAGIAEGPELGARLERTLRRKLDGELIGGRATELESALGGAP
jgi:tRNA nucleotidyltransferase (CCA-adding enzyme)